ncbi:hypothetical protein [Geopsychrobacter electrodiphilus]|uniref:hypothetical protein n=1 Tax=Geopsychrobacter electrodiphilus TaxID=225196 RepID=UPI00036197E4|nr:hypothetical protein [Geopsychrobacter electrodiphilus]
MYQSFKSHSLENSARSLNLPSSSDHNLALDDAEMTGHLVREHPQEIKYRPGFGTTPFDVYLTLAKISKHRVDGFWQKLRTEPVKHGC